MDISLAIKIGVSVVAALVGLGYTFLGKKPQDNPVEEASEQIIKQETAGRMGRLGFSPNDLPTYLRALL